ncbi:hypothetical protein ACHAXT_000296 [Thalassiosira profunda]
MAASTSLAAPAESSRPYALIALTSRPSSAASTSGGARARDPIQLLCPHTGSNVTSSHPLRVPSASAKGSAFGVRCLVPVPLNNMRGCGGDVGNATVFVGHGGSGSRGGGRDDHAFLLSRQSGSASGGGGGGAGTNNPRWKVRPPEPLSPTPQSMAVSPDGRYLAAGSTSGTCFLWEWTNGEDNLVKAWKAHYRPVTCLAFDADDGATLFTAGEDGVVNAWCTLDLVDGDAPTSGAGAIHPYRTWSEHHLPVTSLCVLPGSGRGATRLVSSSLDRNLIVMEVGGAESVGKLGDSGGGARTLARMCLPTGVHAAITDSSGGRLYGGGADGNVYCVDLGGYAVWETLDGAGTVVNVNGSGGDSFAGLERRGGTAGGFDSILSGSHLGSSAAAASSSADQSHYVSELRGHAKAVTCLALLDPAALASAPNNGTTAWLASGSDDGTLRIWDLRSRSCVKVLRPWAPMAEGGNIAAAPSAAAAPPVTGLIAVPRSSLTAALGGTLALSSEAPATMSRRRNGRGDVASMFKPLRRFVRGTSVASHDGDAAKTVSGGCTPILWPRRNERHVQFWEGPMPTDEAASRKRPRRAKEDDGEERANAKAEIARLTKALAESEAVVERWQAVNNQLVAKLKGQG